MTSPITIDRRRFGLLGLAAGFAATSASAQEPWPSRPGRVIVPYPAGGATDVMGRFAAEALNQATAQRFIVENKGGASGAIGSAEVERAAPDGHTLLVATPATHVTNQYLRDKLPYDPDRFEPVVLLSRSPLLLIATSSFPANSVAELIVLAKQKPGKLNYASSGVGATSHLAPELFKTMAGVDITHVPYRGAGPAMTDLIGGQVELMFDNLQTALEALAHRTPVELMASLGYGRLSTDKILPFYIDQDRLEESKNAFERMVENDDLGGGSCS